MHKSGNLMIAGAPANVISLKQITTIIICTSSRAHKYCGQSQQRGFICIKEHLKDVCGWGCWAESLLLRDESSTCWPSRCLAMHIKTRDGINIFPNDLAKWKTITVMIPPRKALMFSYTLNEYGTENIMRTLVSKLMWNYFYSCFKRAPRWSHFSCLLIPSRSAWQMEPLTKSILCRVSRGRSSITCTFSFMSKEP